MILFAAFLNVPLDKLLSIEYILSLGRIADMKEDTKYKSPADKIWAALDRTVAIAEKSRQDMARFKHEEAERRKEERKAEAARRKEEAAWRKASEEELAQIKREADLAQKTRERAMVELLEAQKQTDIQLKETDRQIRKNEGSFNDRWGKLVESLVAGKLVHLLQGRGIEVERHFERLSGNVTGEDGVKRYREFDIVAANGKEAVVVEVKTSLTNRKTNEFLENLKVFRDCLSGYRDKIIYGAVAYLRAEDEAQVYAESQGLFVIAAGDSARIVNSKSFKPKVFFS